MIWYRIAKNEKLWHTSQDFFMSVQSPNKVVFILPMGNQTAFCYGWGPSIKHEPNQYVAHIHTVRTRW